MKIAKLVSIAAALTLSVSARADVSDQVAPLQVYPQLDTTTISFQLPYVPACSGWLTYTSGNIDQARAMYALLLSAVVSNRVVYVAYDAATCKASYITIVNR